MRQVISAGVEAGEAGQGLENSNTDAEWENKDSDVKKRKRTGWGCRGQNGIEPLWIILIPSLSVVHNNIALVWKVLQ